MYFELKIWPRQKKPEKKFVFLCHEALENCPFSGTNSLKDFQIFGKCHFWVTIYGCRGLNNIWSGHFFSTLQGVFYGKVPKSCCGGHKLEKNEVWYGSKCQITTLNMNNSTQSGPILMQSFSGGNYEYSRPQEIPLGKKSYPGWYL